MKTSWDEIKLYHHGDEFFAELISCIRRAKKSITLESYIFELDSISDIILVELQLAVWRGCEVYVMVDGVGSYFWVDTLARRCDREKIFFRIYHPVPSILQWLTPGLLTRLNRRNHRKVLVVDDEFAMLGSFNITRVHSEKIMGPHAWRDSGVFLRGEAVRSLTAAFDLAWNFSKNIPRFSLDSDWTKEKIQEVLQWQSFLRLNVNTRTRRILYRDLLRRLRTAQHRIFIATAYFLPKRALLKALSKAAQRGVDVRILMPGPTDQPFVKWAAFQMPYMLNKVGVQVFEFQPRILHAKYMLIDDWGSIGSLNLNHRSLLHDLEVEAVLNDADSLNNMTHQFQADLLNSKALSVNYYEQSPWWWRSITKILFKLRYWF